VGEVSGQCRLDHKSQSAQCQQEMYALVMLTLFREVGTASHLREIEGKVTLIVRRLALEAPLSTPPSAEGAGA
jgi:hypothetical protein